MSAGTTPSGRRIITIMRKKLESASRSVPHALVRSSPEREGGREEGRKVDPETLGEIKCYTNHTQPRLVPRPSSLPNVEKMREKITFT